MLGKLAHVGLGHYKTRGTKQMIVSLRPKIALGFLAAELPPLVSNQCKCGFAHSRDIGISIGLAYSAPSPVVRLMQDNAQQGMWRSGEITPSSRPGWSGE